MDNKCSLYFCRYWHRSLNPKKLIEVKFSHLSRNMTMQRTMKLYRLPEVNFEILNNIRESLSTKKLFVGPRTSHCISSCCTSFPPSSFIIIIIIIIIIIVVIIIIIIVIVIIIIIIIIISTTGKGFSNW